MKKYKLTNIFGFCGYFDTYYEAISVAFRRHYKNWEVTLVKPICGFNDLTDDELAEKFNEMMNSAMSGYLIDSNIIKEYENE